MTLLAILAFVLADTFLAFFESVLELVPERSTFTAADVIFQRKDQSFQSYTIIQERNIFDSSQNLAPNASPTNLPPSPSKPVAASKERADLKLKLVGTVAGDPASSYAIIEDMRTKKQQLLRVGEKINGAELVSIERHKVTLRSESEERILLAFQETNPSSSKPQAASKSAQPSQEPQESSIREVAENVFEVSREEVTGAFTDVNELMTSVRLVPHFEEGLPVGFQIGQIRSRGFLDRIGLRDGDVLLGINGMLITTPEQAFKAYQELQSVSTIRVDVLRDRRSQALTYRIK